MHQFTDESREARVRRLAQRQRLAVVKSRRRTPEAYDYGKYVVVDPYKHCIVAGLVAGRFGFDLDEVEAYLIDES